MWGVFIMANSILNDAIEIVETTRSKRKSQCSEPRFLSEKDSLLLDSSYRTEALLEILLVLFAKFADRLLAEIRNYMRSK